MRWRIFTWAFLLAIVVSGIAALAFDVLSGSDFHEKPIEGTST